jgi:hypothetical protein
VKSEPLAKAARISKQSDKVFEHLRDVSFNHNTHLYDGKCSFCKLIINSTRPCKFKAHLGCVSRRGIAFCPSVRRDIKKKYASQLAQSDPMSRVLHLAFGRATGEDIDSAWDDFVYENNIAFNAANSDSYKRLHVKCKQARSLQSAP